MLDLEPKQKQNRDAGQHVRKKKGNNNKDDNEKQYHLVSIYVEHLYQGNQLCRESRAPTPHHPPNSSWEPP